MTMLISLWWYYDVYITMLLICIVKSWCNVNACHGQSDLTMMKNDDMTMVKSLINHIGIGICLCGDDGAFILAKTMSFSPMCSVDVGKYWV